MTDPERLVGGPGLAANTVAGESLEGGTAGRGDTSTILPLEGGRTGTDSRLCARADA